MSDIIRGIDCILYWRFRGEWRPIGCMKSWTLSTQAEKGETSTLQSGKFRTYRWVKNTWSVSMTGLVAVPGQTKWSVALLRKGQFAGREIFISGTYVKDGYSEVYQGYVLVDNVDSNATFSTAADFSVEATGTGALHITADPFDPNDITQGGLLMMYPYDGVGGEWSTGPIPDLVGKWVPTCTLDGVDYRRIDMTATFNASNKEFKFDDTTGEVFFNTALPAMTPGVMLNIYWQDQ